MYKKAIFRLFIFSLVICLNGISALMADNSKYLGQEPPGNVPVRFPTEPLLANANWFYHGSPAFSPEADEMFFVKYMTATNKIEIWFTKYADGKWSEPQKAPFSDNAYTNNSPYFYRHKDTLYFLSTRTNGFIFKTTRSNGVWSQPVALSLSIPSGYYYGVQFSIAKNGNIYGELQKAQTNNTDIYLWRLVNGKYNSPEKLSAICSDTEDITPFIDPDEKYILFTSTRTGGYGEMDIYISRHNSDGTWGTPVNLGPKINSVWAHSPSVSQDGKYLFFCAQRGNDVNTNPYWVDAGFLNSLISDVQTDVVKINSFSLHQNYPNPFNPKTEISFTIAREGFYKLSVHNILGEQVEVLLNKFLAAGENKVSFEASCLPSGVYFYTLSGNGMIATKKMLLQK